MVELMVTVVILGVMLAAAWPSISRGSQGAGAYNFANSISSEIEVTRLRAISSRKWQRLVIEEQFIAHDEATTEGLVTPVAWVELRSVVAPNDVAVIAVSPRTHITTNDSVPSAGVGLGSEILFAPDGAAQAATIFVRRGTSDLASVAVFRATGATRVYRDW